jgi:CheY-like chemotaxis protein
MNPTSDLETPSGRDPRLEESENLGSRAAPEGAKTLQGSPGPAPGGEDNKPLILIVDDQPGIRDVLSVVLKPAYRVSEAADGEMALAQAVELLPSLIITDVVMPKMNGVELVAALRQRPDTAQIPVIAMSGYSEPAPKNRLLELGISAHLLKPFPIMAVPHLVENALLAKPSASKQPAEAPAPAPASEPQEPNPAPEPASDAGQNRWADVILGIVSQFVPELKAPPKLLAELVAEVVVDIETERFQKAVQIVAALAEREDDLEKRPVYQGIIDTLNRSISPASESAQQDRGTPQGC